MITPAEINRQEMDNAMTSQAAKFESLIEQIKTAFYDMPAPESDALKWGHVGSAEYVNKELSEILQFLTR
ncbi:MAG: hypothetical protein NTV52_03000 [Acidobacteria bacterium]|nr:hypothetical protein [Acidobacteriota bacterium]